MNLELSPRSLQFEIKHRGVRRYRCEGLTSTNADQTTFKHERLGTISVARYFAVRYIDLIWMHELEDRG